MIPDEAHYISSAKQPLFLWYDFGMKLFLLALLAAIPAAAADTNDAAVSLTMACRPELRGACKPVKGKGMSPLKCLQEHKADASAACRKALDGMKGASLPSGAKPQPGAAGSCIPEFEKVCKGVKSKELASCLKAHSSTLCGLHEPVEGRLVTHVHSQGDVGLMTIASEVTLPHQDADDEPRVPRHDTGRLVGRHRHSAPADSG